MYCSNCGTKLQEADKICSNCGQKESTSKNEISGLYKFLYFIIGLFSPLAGIIVYALIHNASKEESKWILRGFITWLVLFVLTVVFLIILFLILIYSSSINPVTDIINNSVEKLVESTKYIYE